MRRRESRNCEVDKRGKESETPSGQGLHIDGETEEDERKMHEMRSKERRKEEMIGDGRGGGVARKSR